MKNIDEAKDKLKEKINIDEKKKEILYCICIVFVLILLAFGDQIAMHFISHRPNPNNKVFGEEGEVSASDYNVDFLEEISIPEILEKINQQESFLLLSSRDECYTCKKYLPLLKMQFTNFDVQAFFMNRSKYDRDNTYYVEFMKLDTQLEKNLQYTPYLMYFKDGALQDQLVGSKNEEVIVDFIQRNSLGNKKI